jgi:hypothetical protein
MMKETKTKHDRQVHFGVPKCMASAIAAAASQNFETTAQWLRNAALAKLKATGVEIEDAA